MVHLLLVGIASMNYHYVRVQTHPSWHQAKMIAGECTVRLSGYAVSGRQTLNIQHGWDGGYMRAPCLLVMIVVVGET